jgi:hypothetical protein
MTHSDQFSDNFDFFAIFGQIRSKTDKLLIKCNIFKVFLILLINTTIFFDFFNKNLFTTYIVLCNIRIGFFSNPCYIVLIVTTSDVVKI